MAWSGGLTNNTKIALAKDEDKKKKIEEAAKSQSISKAPSSETWDKNVTKRTDNVASAGKGYDKTESAAKKSVPTISAVKKPIVGGYNSNGSTAGRKVFTPSSILAKKTTAQKNGDLFGTQRRTFVPNGLLSKRQTGFTKQEIENTKANQWHGSYGVMPAPTKIISGENATIEKKPGFGKWLTNNLMNGIGQFNRGVINTADFILPTAKDFGGYSAADAFFDYMRGTEDELAKGAARTNAVKGGKWQKAGELVTAVTTALPNTVLAMLSGGTSTGASAIESGMTGGLGQSIVTSASQLAKNPMFWNSFLQTAGNTYDEAKQDGANDIQATATAWISSLINAGVEVGGGIETIPKQTRSISNWVKGMFDEGKEEVIQGIVEQATKKAIYDHDKKVISKSDENAVINPQRAADEFAGGAVVGGVLGAGQMGAGAAIDAYTDTINTGRAMKDVGVVQDVIDTGAHSDQQTSAHKYAEKMQNRQEAGKGLSDWNVGRQFQKNVKAIADETDYINNFANATGVRAEIHSDIDGANGRFESGKTGQRIDISANGDTSIPQTAKHEFTHLFEQNAPEAYKFFKGYILQAATETNQEAVNSRKQRLKNEYESRNLPYTEELLNDEIAAELTEMFSINPANIEKIANGNESLADKILDGIRAAKAAVQTKLTAPYENHNGIQLTYLQLNKAEKMWNTALYEAAQNKRQSTTDTDSVIRYSPIEYDKGGMAYVRIENNILDGVPRNQWSKAVSKWLNQNIQGKKFTAQSDGDVINANRRLTNEYTRGKNSQDIFNTPIYDAKMNLAGNIDEAINISEKTHSASDDIKSDGTLKHGNFARNGWDYRTFDFEYNGQKYSADVNVAKNDSGHFVYDVTNIKEVTPFHVGKSPNGEDTRINDVTSNNSISKNEENVKYSFAGESSKTADLASLENARNMEQEGVDTEDTWQSTGWSKGLEGKWKYEIDDSKARFKNGGFGLTPKTLDAGLEHAELFKAYPDLKNVVVQEDYDIGAKAKYSWFWDYILLNADMSREEKMKSLLHEVQHAIQKREGFARGTNLEGGLENHGKTAGEIEANDVKERLEMTAEERRNVFPESMRPNDDVIFAEDSVSYSKNVKEMFSLKENTGNTQITSDNFKRWFGDWENDPKNASKVINEDGTPKVVYHQTDDDFTIFSTENERAGKTDSDLPTGSFFKSSNGDIGLKGKKQMPVYLDMKNPLEFDNREAATSYWRENIPGYAGAADRIQQIDSEYQMRYDEKPIQSILDEWRAKSDEVRLTAKDFINRYIAGSNFDGIILDKDSGSFGRETDTYIVFRPEQIKSATDNIGTFDTNNADIRYSLKESTGKAEKLSKLYENTMQKEAFTDDFKTEAERREPEFMYEGITNKETYAAAQADIERRGDSKVLSEIAIKNDAWEAEDTAKALALMAQYQTEGNNEKAVDVASMLREKMTRAGQAVQALKIVNKLTPEGQFLDFTRQTDKMVDEQIEKHPAKDKIRQELREAKRKDKLSDRKTEPTARNFEGTIVSVSDNITDSANVIEKLNTNAQDILKIGKIFNINSSNMKKGKNISDTVYNYFNSIGGKAVNPKLGVVELNRAGAKSTTFHGIGDDKFAAVEAIKDVIEKGKIIDQQKNWKNRGYDTYIIAGYGMIDGENSIVGVVVKNYPNGNMPNKFYLHEVTKTGVDLQSDNHLTHVTDMAENVKSKLTPKNRITQDLEKVKKKSHYDEVLDKYNIKHLDENEMKQVSGTLKTLDGLNNKNDLINLILKQSKERKTASHALVKKALEGQDIEFLKDTAIMQTFGKIADKMPSTFAQKASTYQAMSHLLNARTMMRNITSNAAFNTVDRISTNMGSIVDSLIGIFSKQRTVGTDRGVFEKGRFRASANRAAQQYIDIALAVSHGAGVGKYNLDSTRRTFKGKTLGGLERAMSYGLQVTDEWSKGGIEYNIRESLERLKNNGFTADEIDEIAKFEAKYRTFQDDTKLSQVLKGLKDTLNIIGVGETKKIGRLKSHEFGLGDLVQKYTQVPGALITRSIEYSPIGYCKALYHIGKAVYNKSKGAEFSAKDQRNIALSLGRAMTGTGLIALFAGLSKLGIFTGEREDEDEKVKAMENAEGVSNMQLNLSALSRLIKKGEAGGRQNGDVLTSLGFLEPLNTLMAMGNAIGESGNVKNPVDWTKAAGAKTFDQIMDMSTMSTIRSISNTLQYGGGGTDVAIGVIADSATGFIPAPIRQTGSFLDTIQRNPYNEEDNLSRAKARFKASLPIIREDTAAKVTPFGEEKTTSSGNRLLDFFNNFVSPGYVNVYQTSDISDELYRLSETSTDVLPHVPAKTFTVDKAQFKPRGKDYEQYSKMVGSITAEKMRGIINSDEYAGMNDDEKIKALSEAAIEGEKEAKQQYADQKNTAPSRRIFKMSEPKELSQKSQEVTQRQEREQNVNSKLQNISDAVAEAVPDKAKDYSLKSLQINDIRNISLDGKSYSVSNELKSKLFEAANEEYYSNIERLMSNEINIEDVVGYTSKGKTRTSEQADGTKVSLTGKLYNADGTPRFDELVTARIIYKAKENAKNKAAEKYRSEITGAGQESASEKVIPETKTINTLTGRSGSSGKSSGRKSSRSGVSAGRVRFRATEPKTKLTSKGYSGYKGNYDSYSSVKNRLSKKEGDIKSNAKPRFTAGTA